MKYVIIIVALFVIMAGCDSNENDYQNPAVRKMTYNDHEYIIFRVGGNFGQTYVHDPDCKCYDE